MRGLLAWVLTVGLWVLVGPSSAAAVAAGPLLVSQGEFLPADTRELPDDADPRWRPVQLPDFWSEPGRFETGASGWYRFRLAAPAAEAPVQALYFLRGGINLAVWFNRSYLGSGGSFEEPMTFNANRPLLFELPAPLWRAGDDNRVHVYLRGYPYFTAMLPFEVGDARVLEAQRHRRQLLQNDLSFGVMIVSIAIALFALSLWLRKREQTVFLWFGISAVFWAMFGANMSVHNIPVPGRYWLALIHSSIDWSCAAQLVFVHRFLDVRRPRLERLVLGLAALGTVVNFFGGWALLRYGGTLFNLVSVFAVLYAALLSFSHWRRSQRNDALVLGIGLALEFLLAVHDFGLAVTRDIDWYRHSVYLMHYSAPLLLIALGWRMVDRLLQAYSEVERLNRQLERRIEDARESMERAFDQRFALAWRQAVHEERERIHRDLHDDLGATLLSILHSAASDETADLARAALQNLREVVSLRPEELISLRAALQETEDEITHRARMARVELQWRHVDAGDTSLPAQQALHLLRIVREAVSNVLRHSGATQVCVDFNRDADWLSVRVSDNGHGINGTRRGRGMNNMRSRAAELGGTIDWLAADPGPGTIVVLRMPLQPTDFDGPAPAASSTHF